MAALLLVSCDQTKEGTEEEGEQIEGVVTLKSDAQVVVGPEATTVTIVFEANQKWEAHLPGNDWLSADVRKGEVAVAGEAERCQMVVSVAANEGNEDRDATLSVNCQKSEVKVTIVQKQKDALVLAANEIPVAARGENIEIRVRANVEISYTVDVDWITAVETKAMVEHVLNFTVAPNTAYEPREGHVVFSATGLPDQTVTVRQEAAEQPSWYDQFGGALDIVTDETVWAGSFFDGIIAQYAPDGSTEWDSSTEDFEVFFDGKLGFLAGYTTAVNEETGEETVTKGKFKFKKDEKAYSDGTKMSRVQLGGTGVLNQRTNIQFRVSGPGALTLIGRSSGDAARNIAVAVNENLVSEEGYELPDKNADAAKVSLAVEAAEGDFISIFSLSSGINLYSIKWVPGGQPEGPDDPGPGPENPPTPGEGDELDCPNPPTVGTVELDKVYGYGAGVTGGEGATSANVLHFDNGKALQTWLLARTKSEKAGDHSPVIIWLSGTFVPTDGRDFSEAHPWFDVKDVSNLSFYGTDKFVMDRIGIFCVRAKNIIIRNINFRQPKANNGADAVSMQECDGVWVDHCTFTSLNQTKDYEDGSTDVTHASKNVTVSWCHYVKTQKSCLVGHSNSASADAAITATFHHNWFDQSNSRHPRVRFGKVHVYNNYYDNNATYGVGSAYGAKVLVEYNYFDGVHLPTDICTYPAKQSGSSWVSNLTGSVAGYLYATQDVYVNKPDNASNPYPFTNVAYTKYGGTAGTALTYADFKPAYDYVVTPKEDVATVVKAGAGYGKLGWIEAPVAVNNGGITEFDGTDDNPTDPDPDDPDDPDNPDQPGEESAHTHVLYYDSTSALQNLTDGVPGAYFTATAKTDLSSDYCQDFNPWTIGDYSSTKGVKLNSTGAVKFTTSATFASTVEFYFVRRKAGDETAKILIVSDGGEEVVFDTPYEKLGDSGELPLEKGTVYTIKQKSKEQALLLVVVKESE